MQRPWQWLFAPRAGKALLLMLLLGLALFVASSSNPLPFGRLSWQVYDAYQQVAETSPRRDPRIVIVDIDDASLAAHGRWPWSRSQLAELLDAIHRAGPAAIGLDLLLPEPGPAAEDRRLREALERTPTVLATALGDITVSPGGARAKRELAPADSLNDADSPVRLGHITPQLDADGRIRHLYPQLCTPNACRYSLAVALLSTWAGLPPRADSAGAGQSLCVAGFCLKTAPDGRFYLPYHHAPRFTYLSAASVMKGQARATLADKFVLVGTSAAGLGDLIATPRSALTPGVELHAIQLAAMLDNVDWRPLAHARWSHLLGLAWLGGLTLLGMRRGHNAWLRRVRFVSLSILLAAPLLVWWQGAWLDPWPGWLAAMGVVLLWDAWEGATLWRRHRRLYRTFGTYVPHAVLRRLVEEGGEQRFVPQRRWLVVLFSDIRGFTEISEGLSPEGLATLTNHIFTELTSVVHAHGGTLDKYIGDAMMAFWGAPLASNQDATRALACAQAMQQRLQAINRWSEREGFPPITMNIGLEAGEVTVGNLGSRQRLAYTALGHAVNLAARLEELAGQREEPILVGPALAQALDNASLTALGKVHVKGISQPVVLWRPGAK
ncbi:MAG: adenylate/guanylate cyclase domain-containing protein [Halomonas sp.]|uniref:CHASE2 domain-containing protein n=1 Tax=Halomonas sp. TaxID=1486246 RepID=UPI00286FD080|nr:adenylate/guanylate cyclase domain-containing protein [Halomonas sp.]MDR9440412.1 adenylate/guanylate cyclase domain-containing protein [Halomonas sp.]